MFFTCAFHEFQHLRQEPLTPTLSPQERGEGVERALASHAITGLGCRAIASVIRAATMHSAPAAKNAGR
jgi:hypothetical protein